MMLQETKREVCDRRFVGSLRATRNKAWASLYACKASKGVLIIWNTKKLSSENVVIGFFSISIKFLMDGFGFLWLSSVFGPKNIILRKDFWVEILDLFGLTYPN